ncbi:DNA gyrase inhibitor YacG [Acetobacteraceae bacterium KSS8]|uniref:DNA gyrase inhibitor YacG n=1 Tax=Endosaccharibacter trunci TaxID=2812733 RepID=A0ABT1WB78_9PROT|nr:DNA gyrase inhibitor YacG [Acetobacteraceae bacterium KSS8]
MADPDSLVPGSRCPICGRATVQRFKPFCSLRCADADLGRWLTGEYRVPGPPADEADSEARPGRLDLDPDVG